MSKIATATGLILLQTLQGSLTSKLTSLQIGHDASVEDGLVSFPNCRKPYTKHCTKLDEEVSNLFDADDIKILSTNTTAEKSSKQK